MSTVFNIQKFSINDGPGIRTTVFLKGCPLTCLWCHNPESASPGPQLFYDGRKCVGCAACMAICPNGVHTLTESSHTLRRDVCVACGACARGCYSGALEISGKDMTVEEVMATVMQDEIFYQTSGGGMTVSGGEPLMHLAFTRDLLRAAKEKGLHTCIETSGFGSKEGILSLVPYVDLFLYDYKETDPVRHREYTGVSNEIILENLHAIDEAGASIILRCPIIPGYNDRDAHFVGIAETANSLKHCLEINIEPYHPLGQSKSDLLGKEYVLKDLTFPEEDAVKEWMEAIRAHTSLPVRKA